MRSRLAILVLAVFAIGQTGARAQTDEDLRLLWRKGDLAGMEQFARTGDSRAEAWMGLMLRNRSRRPEAKEWFRRAAEKGDRFSLWSMAEIHEQDREYPEAAYWYRRGAEAGMGESATQYAYLSLKGRGVEKNEAEALRWYLRAAELGDRYAYLPLARLYSEGTGTSQNRIEAYAWATIAEYHLDGSDFEPEQAARELKVHLGQALTADQAAAALNRAKELQPGVDSFEKSSGIMPIIAGLGILGVLACIPVGLLLGAKAFVGWAVRKIRGRG
ncbi:MULTISPECIES: tetratricopeptide repeat protein [Microvirga]|uniref:tetratricopeptide repeat protein n=1 Tax=Microvirga TaxID=186650 RepID=UPI0021C8431A|nr:MULTISPECIES: tetratricopeptide repeat protein [unclassified Microvirga]